ncbi:CPW-WPC family protein [Plasmodium ovale curtisi]|uniref:CPW-WPC family protein n=1 Tax=Plasmodium ovale curtisi TaxID=864141 RepID=A0A1A8VX24_PLAOA|nr:CPW-WPC family protein [Plasmodium ovale curtisi]SBS93978.1 CPW-WPC family protein [Plasmodium ovale curtisi]
MKRISSLVWSFLFSFLLLGIYTCYKNPRFSALSAKSKKDISQDLDELYKINEELITNEKEDEEDEEEEHLENTNFDDIARESLEKAEEQATVDLENAEIEGFLDEEIFRVVQERLKKLWYIGKWWKSSAYDTSLCIPPETYEGQCRSIDFSKSTSTDKELFAWKCEVEWPCISSPELKVMDKCPSRWTLVGNNLCIAPEANAHRQWTFQDMTMSLESDGPMSVRRNVAMLTRQDIEMRMSCNVQWNSSPKFRRMDAHGKQLGNYTSGGPVGENGQVLNIEH